MRPLPYLGLRWRKNSLPVENTIAAFDYAMSHGCDGFEFDVRFTRDRRSVLHHDSRLRRKTVAHTEYSGLERRRGYNLACLDEVLTRFGASAYLDIELKVSGEEEALVSMLQAHPPQRGYLVSSFLPEVLVRVHALNPNLPLGYVCKEASLANMYTDLPISAFVPHYSLVSRQLIEDVHARGMQLLSWTVNEQTDLVRLADWGVDGFISDDPRLLARTFPRETRKEN